MEYAHYYSEMNPAEWKFGTAVQTSNGGKKVEVYTDGTSMMNPVWQLWREGEPYLRCPFGISEQWVPTTSKATDVVPTPSNFRSMPMELKYPPHLEFCRLVDNALLSLIHQNQATLLGNVDEDEKLNIPQLRRNYHGLVKAPKEGTPYPPSLGVKVKLGSFPDSTQFFEQGPKDANGQFRTVQISAERVPKGCTVVPIVTLLDVTKSPQGGINVSLRAGMVLIAGTGGGCPVTFRGIPMNCDEAPSTFQIPPNPTPPHHKEMETEDTMPY